MSTWGIGLYQDDVAEDVRSKYIDMLKRGISNDEATNILISEYKDSVGDQDDAPVFWFALADTQWEYGRLVPYVKENAVFYIESGKDRVRWPNFSDAEYLERFQVINQLKQRLSTSLPEVKSIDHYKLYKCEWQNGDVFFYANKNETEASIKGFLLQKIGEVVWWPGHIIPIVYAYVCNGPPNISNIGIHNLVTVYFDQSRPVYRFSIIEKSKRSIPKNLSYTGNYPIQNYEGEYIQTTINQPAFTWSELEEALMTRYRVFNQKARDS